METSEQLLFQKTISSGDTIDPIHSSDPLKRQSTIEKPLVHDIDHHMIDIVASYIRKLPDKKTKKYIARIMLNEIIKSANL